MLDANVSAMQCENIISYPFVRLTEEKTFQDFAEECAERFGGTTEEWMTKNRREIGLFGTRNKTLKKHTRFQFPSYLVKEATVRFFESMGLPRKDQNVGESPSTVLKRPGYSAHSTPDGSPEDINPQNNKNSTISYNV